MTNTTHVTTQYETLATLAVGEVVLNLQADDDILLQSDLSETQNKKHMSESCVN